MQQKSWDRSGAIALTCRPPYAILLAEEEMTLSTINDSAGRGTPCLEEDLHSIHSLARLLPAGQRRLQRWLQVRTFATEEPVYEEGEAAVALYFLVSGSLALLSGRRSGPGDRLKIVQPGGTCGCAALSTLAFYGESCQALEPSRLAVLPNSSFTDMQQRYPDIALALLQGILDETLDDWRAALTAYHGLTSHLTRANIIV